jgi:hypothetical protein
VTIETEQTCTDAAAMRKGRVATLIVTSSMLALVLLQVFATDWAGPASGSASDQQPSAAVITLLRSI